MEAQIIRPDGYWGYPIADESVLAPLNTQEVETEPEITRRWREVFANVMIVGFPFVFLLILQSLTIHFKGRSRSYEHLLHDPLPLIIAGGSSVFGEFVGVRLFIGKNNIAASTKMRFIATGVAHTFGALAVAHLIFNGGMFR